MPKPRTGHKLLNVRISAEQHKALLAEAKECNESASTILRAALRYFLSDSDMVIEPVDRLPQ